MEIEKSYKNRQQLSKVRLGASDPVLTLIDDALINCFSKGFLFIPSQKNIKQFFDSANIEKSIIWEIKSNAAKEITVIDSELKDFINKQKNKLLNKIDELKSITSSQSQHTEEKELLDKLQCFSFNWDDLDGKVYKTDSGYSIIDWGLCDRNGNSIELSTNEGIIHQKSDSEIASDHPTGKTSEKNPLPASGINRDTDSDANADTEPVFTRQSDQSQTPRGETEPDDPIIEPKNNKNWWKKWAIGIGIILLLLLIKNCDPRANIKVIEYQDRYDFHGNKSNDSTSFFQRGVLFSETPANSLGLFWNIFKMNQGKYDLVDSSTSVLSVTLDKQLGKFLIVLKVEDQGNKFGFWKKEDSIAYSIEINELFSDLNTRDTIYIIKYLSESDGAPIDSTIETIDLETISPFVVDEKYLENKIKDQKDKIDEMEDTEVNNEDIEQEKEKLESLEKGLKDKTKGASQESKPDEVKDLEDKIKDQKDKIDEMEDTEVNNEDIEQEKEKLESLEKGLEDKLQVAPPLSKPKAVKELEDKIKDQKDKIDEMEDNGSDSEDIKQAKEKLETLNENLESEKEEPSTPTVNYPIKEDIQDVEIEGYDGWKKVEVSEKKAGCSDCNYIYKETLYQNPLGNRFPESKFSTGL